METVATRQRQSGTTVGATLFKRPYEFTFLQSVTLMQQIFKGSVPVGKGNDTSKEAVKFVAHIAYGVPSSDIYAIHYSEKPPFKVEMNFLTIAGPQGPLPQPYTDLVYEQQRAKNNSLKDFLDIFNHRLVSIAHRVQVKTNPIVSLAPPEDSTVGNVLTSLCGLAHTEVLKDQPLSLTSLLNYTQLLWQKPRSAAGLQTLLTDYFKIPVLVKPLIGMWEEIPQKYRTTLGDKRRGKNHMLGTTAFLGCKFWNQADLVNIELGPLPLHVYLTLLPNGHAHKVLLSLIRFYLGPRTKYKLHLKLDKGDVPRSYLQALNPFAFDTHQEAKLGWTSFLQWGTLENEKVSVHIHVDESST